MKGKLFVFYGEDDFSVKEAVQGVKDSLGPPDAVGTNTTGLEGRTVPFAQLEMACNTIPFLAAYRLVIADGLLDRFEDRGARRPVRKAAKAEQVKGDEWARLGAMAENLPSTSVLVVTGGKVASGNVGLGALSRLGENQRFDLLRPQELRPWLQKRVKLYGGSIAAAALQVLADYGGSDLRLLDSEVQKLCAYSGNAPITEEVVRSLVSDTRDASIFGLVDNMIEGRRPQAIALLRQLLDAGATGPYLITMLARQVRMMIMARSMREAGVLPSAMAQSLGTTSDYVVRKALEQSQTYRPDQLRGLLQQLLDLDIALKTGRQEEDLGLEMLVVELAARR